MNRRPVAPRPPRRNRGTVARLWRAAVLAIGTAWALGAVRRGFLGVCLATLGGLSPAYLPPDSPWWQVLEPLGATTELGRSIATVLVMVGLALIVDAWFRLRPAGRLPVNYAAVLAVWSAPMVFAPPIYSRDAYSYAAQGWMVHNGVSPYQVGPGALPGPFADPVERVWLHTPAPYGPLSLQLQHWLVDLTGHNAYWAAVSMRLLALIGVALLAAYFPLLMAQLRLPVAPACWFVLLNPLVLLHFVGGAHNDALMLGLVVAGLWCGTGRHYWWGLMLVGVATAIKQPAALAAVAIVLLSIPARRRTWSNWVLILREMLVGGLVAGGTFAGVSLLTGLGFGWLNAVNVPGMVPTIAPTTMAADLVKNILIGFGLYEYTGRITLIFRVVGMVFTVGLIGWFGVRIALRRPLRFLSWSYLAFALGGPALHVWYLMWGGLLLPMSEPSSKLVRGSVWATVGLVVYTGGNVALRNDSLAIGLVAVLGIAGVALWHDRRLMRNILPSSG